jgi:hypothetical protein
MPMHERPIFTQTFAAVDKFLPTRHSVYVSGRSVESRSEHIDGWRAKATEVTFVDIVENEDKSSIRAVMSGEARDVALRSSAQIDALWEWVRRPTLYLDITGLRHHVWAPLLNGALRSRSRVVATYVEPHDYRPSLTPTEHEIYDLSERIEGISPLPGFARLRDTGDHTCFVPLLGFEGTRVAYLIGQLEPPGEKTVPVVGVPGFRLEYPFATYLGNRRPLLDTQAWKAIRYAAANCPFDLFYVLQEIAAAYPGHTLRIAPIGTKPHALGGVLFAIANPGSVELVYDHPIRKARRTEGTARVLAYHVSALFG